MTWRISLISCLVAGLVAPLSVSAMAGEAKGTDEQASAQASQVPGRFTETFDTATAAYDRGDHERAYALWLSVAEQGDLAAMRNVAHMLRHGRGVDRDIELAARWYTSAAKRGLTGAQVNLADLFYRGEGAPQSYEMAARWYARAARAGHAHAQFKLALMIEEGHVNPGNTELAKKLYGWAIDAGHSGALENFRRLEARTAPLSSGGRQGDSDHLDALQISSSLKSVGGGGDLPDEAELRVHEEDRPELLRAQVLFVAGERGGAVTAWRGLAITSNREAQYRLGLALLQGHGVKADTVEARHWLDVAATAGHEAAATLLATFSE